MAKTEGITRYVCDRCGKEAYLSKGDPAISDWRDVSRVTADGVQKSVLLCSSCNSDYKSLAAGQDAEYNAFMAESE